MQQNVIGFYAPEKENGGFSNWFPSVFEYAGLEYTSAEQFMMAQKAVLFGDYEIYNEILLETDPKTIKALGKEVLDYDDAVWAKLRQPIMRRGLRAKFQQNPALLEQLLSTGDALLAECSPRDRTWGIGLSVDDPAVQDPKKWKGENLLGKTLMQVRADLRRWMAVSGGDITYRDAVDAEPNAVWALPVSHVMHLPEYRPILDLYFEVTLYRLHGDRFLYESCTAALDELERLIAGDMGGGLPAAWFFEMKQDLYDAVRFNG